MEEIEIREALPADLNFIFATWLRSYRHSSAFAKYVSNEVYFYWHQRIINNALERGARILVAHPKGDPEVIIGYLCYEYQGSKLVGHYIFVKGPFRKMGIAKSLLAAKETFDCYTHRTEDFLKLKLEIEYNPYLL